MPSLHVFFGSIQAGSSNVYLEAAGTGSQVFTVALSELVGLVASGAGSEAVTAQLSVLRSLSSFGAGAEEITAVLAVVRDLIAVAQGSQSGVGSLSVDRQLAALAQGSTALSAAASLLIGLQAIAEGNQTITAELSISSLGGVVVDLCAELFGGTVIVADLLTIPAEHVYAASNAAATMQSARTHARSKFPLAPLFREEVLFLEKLHEEDEDLAAGVI